MGDSDPGEKQAQVVVYLCDRTHRGSGVVRDTFLVYGDGRRETFDVIDVRLVHASEELPGVG